MGPRGLLAFALLGAAAAQRAGSMYEEHPPVSVGRCAAKGCKMEQAWLTLDANARWVHGVRCSGGRCHDAGQCFDAGAWNATACATPEQCAGNCALEGVNLDSYINTYGVGLVPRGIEFEHVKRAPRLYMLARKDRYKVFRLKNREFAFDVDVSQMPCGLVGAVYFVEMPADGGRSAGNRAGAGYGTGYCDAQCPRGLRFTGAGGNVRGWDAASEQGQVGRCCSEMDLWEANRAAEALTAHTCEGLGPMECQGAACGGQCDPAGCALGSGLVEGAFFGPGSRFAVDTTRPLTVVTQFVTNGGDAGELSEVRRLYLQGGRVVYNWNATAAGRAIGSYMTDGACGATGAKAFAAKGGMVALGRALDRGMVLAMSLWHDKGDAMGWARGPCRGQGLHGRGKVRYSNFMYGDIGSALKFRGGGPKAQGLAEQGPGPEPASLRPLAAPGPRSARSRRMQGAMARRPVCGRAVRMVKGAISEPEAKLP